MELPADDAAVRWLASLAEAVLTPCGHLVADLAVIERSQTVGLISATIEVLTVEDR